MFSQWLSRVTARTLRALIIFWTAAAALDIALLWSQTRTPPTHFSLGLWVVVGLSSAPMGLLAAGVVLARDILQAVVDLGTKVFEFPGGPGAPQDVASPPSAWQVQPQLTSTSTTPQRPW